MSERIRVGVIGAGSLGSRHARTLALRTPGAELAAVADQTDGVAEDAAALSPGAYATTDYRAVLADASIHALVIATPNDTHAQLIVEAAHAGKDIFCEKPLGLDLESADAALEAVSRNSVKLQIGFQRRFDPAYREAHRALASGEMGDVELVVGTTRDPAPPPDTYFEHSGSFFADTAIHDFDSVRYLTGLEVTAVFATAESLIAGNGSDPAVFDTAASTLWLENGALCSISNRRRSNYGYDVRIEVCGSQGTIALGEERRTAVRKYSEAGVSHDFVGSYWELFEDAYVAELQHFVECVARDHEPEVGGEIGRRALAIALAADQSASTGHPVALSEVG